MGLTTVLLLSVRGSLASNYTPHKLMETTVDAGISYIVTYAITGWFVSPTLVRITWMFILIVLMTLDIIVSVLIGGRNGFSKRKPSKPAHIEDGQHHMISKMSSVLESGTHTSGSGVEAPLKSGDEVSILM